MDDVSLIDGPLVVAIFATAAVALVWVVLPRLRRGADSRWEGMRFLGITAAVGLLVGTVLTWLLSDVLDVFGVSLSWAVRIATAVGFGALGAAVGGFVVGGLRRRLVAPLSILLTIVAVAAVINIDLGYFPTVAALDGDDQPPPLETPLASAEGTLADWVPPAGMPSVGTVYTAEIAPVYAKFTPRTADVYLPPAALVADPPPLPVVIALSGQPGSPMDLFTAGNFKPVVDQIAATHHGLAPIVVVPDQLTASDHNPMCVDGPLGDSATYITVDVPRWIEANLPATTDHSKWTIAGFSQGGTCSMQLGAGHPELFGSLVDISGELVPSIGTEQETIDVGFNGDRAAYLAATPAEILKAHAPYKNFTAYFASGSEDLKYTATVTQVAQLAKAAGMTVARQVSPGTGHDWNTVHWAFKQGFRLLLNVWGLQ